MAKLIVHEHRMARGTVYLMFSQLVFLITGYVIHFGLGRWLRVGIYGQLGLILSLLSIMEIMIRSGIPQAVSKFIAEDQKLALTIKNNALKIQIIFAFVLFVVFFLSAPLIATLLSDPGLINYIRLSAIDIPIFSVFCVYIGTLDGIREFRKHANVAIIYSVTKVASILTFVLLGYALYGAIIGYIFASAIGLIVARSYCKFESIKGEFRTKKLVQFAVPVIIFSVALTALMTADLLFVQALLADNTKTGYYTSASIIARLPYYMFAALSTTLLPSISKSIAKKADRQTREYINSSLRYMLMLSLPVVFLVSATSDNLISLVYTSKYALGAQSLSILILGLTFLSVFVILATVITASGKPKISMCFVLVLIPIEIILFLILIPGYQLEGAAIATTITAFIGLIIASIYVFGKFKALINPLSFVKITIASLLIYLISLSLPLSGVLLILGYIGLLLVYMLILLGIKEIKKEDIGLFKELFMR